MCQQKIYIPTYILLVNDHDVCTYHQRTNCYFNCSQQTKEQTEVIQPVVYTLNHVAMNKKQVDQMQFSLEKRLDKRNWIHPTHRTRRSIVL